MTDPVILCTVYCVLYTLVHSEKIAKNQPRNTATYKKSLKTAITPLLKKEYLLYYFIDMAILCNILTMMGYNLQHSNYLSLSVDTFLSYQLKYTD